MKSFAPLLTAKNKAWFLALDILLFGAAIFIMSSLRLTGDGSLSFSIESLLITVSVPVMQYIFGNYDLDHIGTNKQLLVRQLMAFILTLITATVVIYLFVTDREGLFGRGVLIGSLVLFSLVSLLYRRLVITYFKTIKGKLKWLVIADPETQDLVSKDFNDLNFEGTLEFFNPDRGAQALKETLAKEWTTLVISIKEGSHKHDLGNLIIEASCNSLTTITIVEFYERHLRKVPVQLLDYQWFINAEGFDSLAHPIQLRLKRLMDIAISGSMLLLASPVMLIVALIIKLESKGPALYNQTRTGQDNKPFTIYKFRSMRTDAEKNGAQWAVQNDTRITKIGKFIRLTRLDELPQLWNVLKGEMSFVGPRPERPEFNEMLKKQLPYYDLRHTLRPGLTGWAQVLYPYGASIEDSKEKLQ
ncbi:MAG: exopolysaccharide biosynthesis polyprenyl glycosylphosphotransferase, partial [Bdellovibrio sp.]